MAWFSQPILIILRGIRQRNQKHVTSTSRTRTSTRTAGTGGKAKKADKPPKTMQKRSLAKGEARRDQKQQTFSWFDVCIYLKTERESVTGEMQIPSKFAYALLIPDISFACVVCWYVGNVRSSNVQDERGDRLEVLYNVMVVSICKGLLVLGVLMSCTIQHARAKKDVTRRLECAHEFTAQVYEV